MSSSDSKEIEYVLFSKSGFTKAMEKQAANEGIDLHGIADFTVEDNSQHYEVAPNG